MGIGTGTLFFNGGFTNKRREKIAEKEMIDHGKKK